MHAQVTSPEQYSDGTRKTRLLAKGKAIPGGNSNSVHRHKHPDVTQAFVKTRQHRWEGPEADFQQAALRFLFIYLFYF